MKYIYTLLILSFIATGCGYKAPPVYVDDKADTKQNTK